MMVLVATGLERVCRDSIGRNGAAGTTKEDGNGQTGCGNSKSRIGGGSSGDYIGNRSPKLPHISVNIMPLELESLQILL